MELRQVERRICQLWPIGIQQAASTGITSCNAFINGKQCSSIVRYIHKNRISLQKIKLHMSKSSLVREPYHTMQYLH